MNDIALAMNTRTYHMTVSHRCQEDEYGERYGNFVNLEKSWVIKTTIELLVVSVHGCAVGH